MSYIASVFGPSNNAVESSFDKLNDGRYSVKFRPLEAGKYKIQILKQGSNAPVSEFQADIGADNVGDNANFTIR